MRKIVHKFPLEIIRSVKFQNYFGVRCIFQFEKNECHDKIILKFDTRNCAVTLVALSLEKAVLCCSREAPSTAVISSVSEEAFNSWDRGSAAAFLKWEINDKIYRLHIICRIPFSVDLVLFSELSEIVFYKFHRFLFYFLSLWAAVKLVDILFSKCISS